MTRFRSAVAFLVIVGAAVLATPAAAVTVNPSFESGDLTGWTSAGDATTVTLGYGSGPTDGSWQAVLTTGTGSVTSGSLESAMGLSSGFLVARLDDIHPKTKGTSVTEGSAIQQTFNAIAGDTLTFDYNFLTNVTPPEQTYTDFLFYDLTGVGSGVLSHARLQPSQFSSSGTPFANETGFQTVSFTLPTTGTYTLTLGVADVQDTFTDSGAIFDFFRLVRAPEPGTASLLAFGLLALAARRRR